VSDPGSRALEPEPHELLVHRFDPLDEGWRVVPEGDALRVFEAVVRPGEDGQGDLEAEIERVRKEIERGEKMLANERFRARAPAEVVEAEEEKLAGYRAELDALGG